MRFVLIAGLALLLVAKARAAERDAVILTGGAIYTLDAQQPWAEAIVISAGKIVYVGGEAGARVYASHAADARVIDLGGRLLLPAFHDSHIHPMSGGMRLLRCQLGALTLAREVYDTVRRCAAARPKGVWVLGSGWSRHMFFPHGPSLAKLDEIVPDRPVFLTTEDGYTAWVNSRALAAAGLDVTAVETSGVLEGDGAELVRRQIPPPSQGEYREALRRSTAMANRFGITSLVDASGSPAMLEAYHVADAAGELSVRVTADQRVDTSRGVEQVDEMVVRRERMRGRRFRADGAKIFLDGDIERRTAAMLEPYVGTPLARGDLLIEPDALTAIVRRLDGDGFRIRLHAMGDRAVRVGLDAIEQAALVNGGRSRRHQLSHIGVADPADIRRFGPLKVTADFQPIWVHAADPATKPSVAALGRARSRFMYPMASIASAGGRIVASSDWPSPSMNPLDGIQVALTRQPLDGSEPPFHPEERVDLTTMLAAYTIDAAWVAGAETVSGSIEVGKAADLVVLDRNVFKVDVPALHKVRVVLTLLDGKPVFRDPSFNWPE